MRQRGFAFLTLLPYLLGFLAVSAVLGTAAYNIRKAGADAVRAELQPKLEACEGAVKAQNDALAALKAAADAKAKAASQALAKAEAKARVWDDQAKRLRAILTQPRASGPAPTTCDAAWKAIRETK